MRIRPRVYVSGVVISTVAFLCLPVSGAFADPSAGAPTVPLTYQSIAAMPLVRQAAVLDPLRAAAGAADGIGRSVATDVYAGVEIDAPAHLVYLYLTDTSRGAGFLAAARAAHPTADLGLVRVRAAAYTRAALEAARDRLAARLATLPVIVENANVPADGSALQLGVTSRPGLSPALASDQSAMQAVAGVAVQVTEGHSLTAADRYGDTAPFYAGDYIIDSGWACTTGVPVKNASGHQYILTASHCGHTGTHWNTGRGVSVGTVVNYSEHWDAALIDAPSAAWEFDGPAGPAAANTLQLVGTAYSYTGDLVCQDGYTTGVACGIRVDNQDAQNFSVRGPRYGNTFLARGVIGHQINGGIAVQGGDSGGLVFTINSGGATRQVRGIVSSSVDGTGLNGIFWTEALDIYNQFGLHLTDRLY
jgi:hypothetical protein